MKFKFQWPIVLQKKQRNLRGLPTAACPNCGGDLFCILAIFDDEYNVGLYMTDATCYFCDTKLTAPTPLDLYVDLQNME